MTLDAVVATWRGDPRFMANVTAWRTLPAQPPRLHDLPAALDPRLGEALAGRGIRRLYTHQAQAVELALGGLNVAVVTPTASGKTLCYNLPILHALLNDPEARALYLFPTKALAQDQLTELGAWQRVLGAPLHPATYDGDTAAADRTRIRKQSRLILTNPDMLHVGILPYHTQWAAFLAGLRWVVIDEMHTYRGVFGSQVANVLRRLQRLCAHYGGSPQFICTSATIANPKQLAERLVERPVELVDDNGAPRGEKHILLLNPPLLDADKGIRRSATLEATDLAVSCLAGGLQTIVFGRSRLTTELLLTYIRDKLAVTNAAGDARSEMAVWDRQWPQASEVAPGPGSVMPERVRGYRGGYLAHERREIEAALRSGDLRGVVATNALELGIDIGQLQACVICGYPGSIAGTWQQMGRAGRTTEAALALLVATGGALDQYVVQHPEFVLERSPEHALINPDNLVLLLDQLRCAAFELPFMAGDGFGNSPFVADGLALLVEEGDLHLHQGQYFWSGDGYPARSVSLRSAGGDPVVIQALWDAEARGDSHPVSRGPVVIGEVDQAAALRLVHEGAIYLHEGRSYQVRTLDLPALRADVIPVAVDYYTQTISDVDVQVLAEHGRREGPMTAAAFGEVEVTAQVVGYRRIMRHTHTLLGVQQLEYPPQRLVTSAYWLTVQPQAQAALEQAGLWYDSVNDYGPNWAAVRKQVRARDHYRCTQCGVKESPGQEHDVHHLIPFRSFGYVRGANENYLLANRLENLVLVCRSCHQRLETAGRLRTGMDGLAYALGNLAPLHLMCDQSDLGVYVARSETHTALARAARTPAATPDVDFMADAAPVAPAPAQPSPGTQLATVYLYEQIPAGLGFSAALYDLHDTLLAAARALVGGCGCRRGCPACVGPVLDDQPMQLDTKALTLGLLDVITSTPQHMP